MLTIDQARRANQCSENEIANLTRSPEHVPLRLMDDTPVAPTTIEEEEPLTYRAPRIVAGRPFNESCLDNVRKDMRVWAKAKRLQRLSNAQIIGWNAILSEDGQLYDPTPVRSLEDAKRTASRTRSGFHGYALRWDEKEWSVVYNRPAPDYSISGHALFLGSIEPGNYGSFLFRSLPRLLLWPRLEHFFDLLIVSDRTPWMVQVLKDLDIQLPVYTAKEVVGMTIRDLSFFWDADNEGMFSTGDISRLRQYTAQKQGETLPVINSRLYVSRKLSHLVKPHFHPMLNEQEVEQFMAKRGFEIIYPETFTFDQQIAVFSRAEFIVGPSGSGMLNACFASENTKVLDLESFTNCVRQHARIYSSTGKDFSFCFGTVDSSDPAPPVNKRWTLDTGLLAEVLDQMESGG